MQQKILQLRDAAAADHGKGNPVHRLCPDYGPRFSARRRAAWEHLPGQDRYPSHRVPNGTPMANALELTCHAHNKTLCGRCKTNAENKARHALSVEQCCEVHHRPDDNLPQGFCRKHRRTACERCIYAHKCCPLHHGDEKPLPRRRNRSATDIRTAKKPRQVGPTTGRPVMNSRTAPTPGNPPGAGKRSRSAASTSNPLSSKKQDRNGPKALAPT